MRPAVKSESDHFLDIKPTLLYIQRGDRRGTKVQIWGLLTGLVGFNKKERRRVLTERDN